MFGRKKKPQSKPKFAKTGAEERPAPDLYFGVERHAGEVGEDPPPRFRVDGEEVARRAPHNPHQALVPRTEGDQRSSSEIVAAAGTLLEMGQALQTIAARFEQGMANVHALNVGLQEFKRDLVIPFREELKHLRYTTGDRLNKTSTDLERYVYQLDKVLWGALRSTGMSDAQIKLFREEHGMHPEAPSSQELEAHLDKTEAMERTIADLVKQNRRLIAAATGHDFAYDTNLGQLERDWTYHAGCECEVCVDHARELGGAFDEAGRA